MACVSDPAEPDVALDDVSVAPGFSVEVTTNAVAGTWHVGDDIVDFAAELSTEGVASARYSTTDIEISIRLDAVQAELVLDGVSIDGFGALTESERSTLERLASSSLYESLIIVPLEVGCETSSVETRLHRAALVFPWQLLIKHGLAPSGAPYESSCEYVTWHGEVDGIAEVHGLELDSERSVPYVFGIFPFDAEGATDDGRMTLSDETGPCGAMCRGACGADCLTCMESETRICDGRTGRPALEITRVCPTHEACRTHDDCYDWCNDEQGCGSWGAAACMRFCDTDCIEMYSLAECKDWIYGQGILDESPKSFVYFQPVEDTTECVPPLCPLLGMRCTATSECCDGPSQVLCAPVADMNDLRCCERVDGRCEYDTDCCGAMRCESGSCQCNMVGEPCLTGRECCDGSFCAGACDDAHPCAHGTCVDGRCSIGTCSF
jgi:hypothetical protein